MIPLKETIQHMKVGKAIGVDSKRVFRNPQKKLSAISKKLGRKRTCKPYKTALNTKASKTHVASQ